MRQGAAVVAGSRKIKADSMICVWPSQGDDEDNRRQACLAALEMRAESRVPMAEKPGFVLDSRIGLHFGKVELAPLGGAGHFEYSLIGDDVNTASRIESANKHLGTHIMASRPVVEGLQDIFVRSLGIFVLKGKTKPLELFEILGALEDASPEDLRFQERFAGGLALFRESQWADAAKVFSAALASRPGDGPSRFFLARCQERQASLRQVSPVIELSQK